jgi:bifunctional oligoribonuclease and PAP phosphatase NrnA
VSISEDAWSSALDILATAEEPVLACHIGPDGDAMGSTLALALAMQKIGKSPKPSWSEPFGVPKQYAFVPGQELLVPPSRVPESPEVMWTFDAGSMERLGTLEGVGRAAKNLVVVDHHVSNDNFGTVNLVDPQAAASAVVVYELIRRAGIDLDRDIATLLYLGLVTDTGRFQYRNTTPSVHEMAADLLSHGIAHDEIARLVYDTHSFGYLKLLSTALDRAEIIAGASMVWTWITQADLAANQITLEDTEALIDMIRTAAEAEVAAALKETPEGRIKVSMRSKGSVNVGAICEALGGGGHALAAGFTAAGGDARAIVEDLAGRLARAQVNSIS